MPAPKKVVVHPIVLLSIVDHYNRVARDTKKRVVGVLLGEAGRGGQVDITNCYAVPFEEDPRDPKTWFLDHNYHEDMYEMFRKVSAKEKVVGWYSTGPKIRPADLEIHELIRGYTPHPALVIVDVNPSDKLEIPTSAYVSVEDTNAGAGERRRTFTHIPAEVGAYEAEEVGVEHLLRDLRDTTTTSLAEEVSAKMTSLKGLEKRLRQIHTYLSNVADGRIPPNPQIIYNIQDMFNLAPNLKVEQLVRSFAVKNNDNMLVIYLSSLVRAIIALNNLIDNKIMNNKAEARERFRASRASISKAKDKKAKKAKAEAKAAKEAAEAAEGNDEDEDGDVDMEPRTRKGKE